MVTQVEARFYGERKLNLRRLTSVHACINSKVKSPAYMEHATVHNTVVLLILKRKATGEKGMRAYLAHDLKYSSNSRRASTCRKWLRKMNRTGQTEIT